jgi:riboflavin synthase
MFTGLIEQVGTLDAIEQRGNGAQFRITHAPWPDAVAVGESIAVEGACLTVAACGPRHFTCDVLRETLDVTTLGGLVRGARVNLERAMRVDGRFGGHLVSGHIDTIGDVVRLDPTGRDWVMEIACGDGAARGIVYKGSIAVNGISLTVSKAGPDRFEVTIIPYTLTHTSLDAVRPGSRVNLELDMIGKYVRQAVAEQNRPELGMDDLRRAGFVD